jgi:hypothetical protein
MRTRTAAIVLPAVVGLALSAAAPAQAASPRPRPQVEVGGLTGPAAGAEGSPEWTLSVDAIDPDGVIWEVAVRWGDGSMSWATTLCLQGGDPGTPAHLLIPHSYASSGRYRVQVEATSHQSCSFGDTGAEQTSHPVTKMFTVSG